MIKLGPHSLVELGDTVRWADELKPTVVKLCYDFSPATYIHGPLIIGRPEERFIKSLTGDPIALAAQMAREVYAPLIAAYPTIAAWEGPNEVNPATQPEMVWYAQFLAELARRIWLMDRKPIMGAWATGTPEPETWQWYRPLLDTTLTCGTLLSRHCYGPLNDWHAFRFQRDQAKFRALGYNPTIVITECGEDAPDPPWRKKFGDNIGRYWREWLKPFLLELNKADYILGATVFTVGDGHAANWHYFDVSGTGLIELMKADRKEIEMSANTNMVVIAGYEGGTNGQWPGTDEIGKDFVDILNGKYGVNLAYFKSGDGPTWAGYFSRGIMGQAFSIENPTVGLGEDVWFRFRVQNVTDVTIEYTALAAHTDQGYSAWSWTMQKLKPGEVLEWRDRMRFDAEGVFPVYLGVNYSGSVESAKTTAWDHLSPAIPVTVGKPAAGKWWQGWPTPFKAYSKMDFENRIVWFGSEKDQAPHYRAFTYAMDVLAISGDGLRFKVYDNPKAPVEGCSQIWVYAGMAQPNPS